MTNFEYSLSLTLLADLYESRPGLTEYDRLNLTVYCGNKEDVIRVVKAVGGKFQKKYLGEDNYAVIRFESDKIPGFAVVVSRDKLCKKTTTWECEPLLSLQDEEEILSV